MKELIEIIEENIDKAFKSDVKKREQFDFYISKARFCNKELHRDYGFTYGDFVRQYKETKRNGEEYDKDRN